MDKRREVVEATLPEFAEPLYQEPPPPYVVFYGGRGGARSWTVARALLIRAARRRRRVLCTREFQNSIRDSVHALLKDQIELLGLGGFKVLDQEIRHTNGSLFVFWGLRHNPEKIKSLEGVDDCWVEEAETVPDRSWELLIPTVRGDGSQIIVTFNPDLESDSTYQRFVLHPPPGAVVRKVGHADNPWFPERLRQEMAYLQRVDPDAAAHVWDGECRRSSEAQILHGKWVVEDVDPPEPDPETGQREGWDGPYYGLDFGFATDPAAGVELWVQGRVLHVQRELYRLGLELDEMVPALEEALPGIARHVVRADSARPDSISYLKKHGLPRIVGAAKGAGSVEDGIAHLRSYERIVVHSRCRSWKQEAREYSYKVDPRSGDVLPIIVDRANNLIDGSRYALEPLIRPGTKAFRGAERAVSRKVRPLFGASA